MVVVVVTTAKTMMMMTAAATAADADVRGAAMTLDSHSSNAPKNYSGKRKKTRAEHRQIFFHYAQLIHVTFYVKISEKKKYITYPPPT